MCWKYLKCVKKSLLCITAAYPLTEVIDTLCCVCATHPLQAVSGQRDVQTVKPGVKYWCKVLLIGIRVYLILFFSGKWNVKRKLEWMLKHNRRQAALLLSRTVPFIMAAMTTSATDCFLWSKNNNVHISNYFKKSEKRDKLKVDIYLNGKRMALKNC